MFTEPDQMLHILSTIIWVTEYTVIAEIVFDSNSCGLYKTFQKLVLDISVTYTKVSIYMRKKQKQNKNCLYCVSFVKCFLGIYF